MARSTLRTSCVILLAFATTIRSSDLDLLNCDNVPMRAYYRNIGCIPEGDGPCPASYNCDDVVKRINPGGGKCRYENTTYEKGETFKTKERCIDTCECVVEDNGVTRFSCSTFIDCGALFELPEGCYNKFTLGSCCPDGTLCQNDTSIAKCEYGGETYYEGVNFSPDNFGCVTCNCQKGFNGTIAEPWCTLSSYNYVLFRASDIQGGCVPIFNPSACYARDWRCPKKEDLVVSSSATPDSTSMSKCTFGKLELKIGEKLNGEANCTCIIPPHVTCTK
ncbi:uncharacterized protein [Anabrus simplex]|uniref:uncharacterized protein n=1 Tax=Anabrus simplex TaxID=316456 RepID=UPI0035A2C73F